MAVIVIGERQRAGWRAVRVGGMIMVVVMVTSRILKGGGEPEDLRPAIVRTGSCARMALDEALRGQEDLDLLAEGDDVAVFLGGNVSESRAVIGR